MRGIQGRLGRVTVSFVVVAAGLTSLVASTEGAPKAAAAPVGAAAAPASAAAAPASAALWTYNAGAQAPAVCVDPPAGCALPAPDVTTAPDDSQPGAVDLVASDDANFYAVAQTYSSYNSSSGIGVFSVWSCPIVEYGTGCVRFNLTNIPSVAILSVDLAVDTAGVVGQPGETYLFIGDSQGTISRCPVADAGSVACTRLQSPSAQRQPPAMVVANGYLWVALQHGGYFGNGLLWRCGLWTSNSCQVFDDPKGPDLISLEVGGGYLWAGRSDGVIWRCDMAAANRCAVWDTAATRIEALSYDGAGILYAAVPSTKKQYAVVWSCSTAHANGCLPVPADGGAVALGYAGNVEAGGGGVFNVSATCPCSWDAGWNHRLNFGSVPLSPRSYYWTSMALLYVPAGGLAPLGGARVGIPDLKGRFAKLGALCTTAGQVWADLSVTGPHGVQFDRRVDVCAPNAAGWSFGSLDAGRYTASVRVHQFVLRGSAMVAGPVVTEFRMS